MIRARVAARSASFWSGVRGDMYLLNERPLNIKTRSVGGNRVGFASGHLSREASAPTESPPANPPPPMPEPRRLPALLVPLALAAAACGDAPTAPAATGPRAV